MAAYWLGCLAGLAADWYSRLPVYAPNGHLPARALFLPSPIPLRPPGVDVCGSDARTDWLAATVSHARPPRPFPLSIPIGELSPRLPPARVLIGRRRRGSAGRKTKRRGGRARATAGLRGGCGPHGALRRGGRCRVRGPPRVAPPRPSPAAFPREHRLCLFQHLLLLGFLLCCFGEQLVWERCWLGSANQDQPACAMSCPPFKFHLAFTSNKVVCCCGLSQLICFQKPATTSGIACQCMLHKNIASGGKCLAFLSLNMS